MTHDPQTRALVAASKNLKEAKGHFARLNNSNGAPLDWSQEVNFAIDRIGASNQLQRCDPTSIRSAIRSVAAMGLSLNPATKHLALIPRWNSKKRCLEMQASPQYQGILHLARQTSLLGLNVEPVFEGEHFQVELGTSPRIEHKPDLFAPDGSRTADFLDPELNKLRGVYLVAEFKGAELPFVSVMGYEELLAVAMKSDAFNPRPDKNGKKREPSGPWVDFPVTMARKVLIRRSSNQWPLSDTQEDLRLRRAIQIDADADTNEAHHEARSAPVEGVICITERERDTLVDLCKQQDLPMQKVAANYKISDLKELPSDKYEEVHSKLMIRLQKANARKKERAEAAS